jgi:adenylate cyclase
VTDFSRQEAATRAGVTLAYFDRLVELGILVPADGDLFSAGDSRRALLCQTIAKAGIPLEGLADAIRAKAMGLSFLDDPMYDRFPTYSNETFAQASARTGIPFALLVVVRESIGLSPPTSDDPLRADELEILPFVQLQVDASFRPSAIERVLRGYGDSFRRVAEVEADWYASEVLAPHVSTGDTSTIGRDELSRQLMVTGERTMMAMVHAHQGHAWTNTIMSTIEQMLAQAGLRRIEERHPAMCFLDITGYTRLTQERGDAAAAELAETLSRLVTRASVRHGGKPVKWLGDGVMFHFREPGPGVVAALAMVRGVAEAGLPPAHVGLHSGPVVFQEGDYFGQTVNMASRIADYARQGEVLVSRSVVSAAGDPGALGLAFTEIGPVELKGVADATELFSARMV